MKDSDPLAVDDLDAPLGKDKKRRKQPPIAMSQVVAGALGLSIALVGVWTVVANDPYGGEPIAIVATRMNSKATATDRNVAAAALGGDGPVMQAKMPASEPPPGAKVITITDGSSGKTQQVVVPPRGAPTAVPIKSLADPELLEDTRHGKIPKIAADGRRASAIYAHPVTPRPDGPRIAIVVGGLGVSTATTADALARLPAPVTLAFAPYGADLDNLAARARDGNHEVLLQAPMEPFDYPDNDPGPQTLLTSLPAAQNVDRLQWLMARMQGYVGISNLMGSRLTASDQALTPILREVAQRGLIYFDDGSSPRSIAGQVAGGQSLPFAKADIVLDAVPAAAEIDNALSRLEMKARERGSAIGFANASATTIARIADWAKQAADRGFVLVPISMVAVKPKSS